MKTTSFLLLLFLFISCGENKDTISLENIKESSLQLKELSLNEPPLFPKGCLVVDSLLITYNPKDPDGFISIYNTKEDTLLKKFGKIGAGPNEFNNPRFLANKNIFGSDIVIGDATSLRFVNIDSILSAPDYVTNSRTEVPTELKSYNYFLKSDDAEFIVNKTGEHQLTFYDRQTKELKAKNYFERIDKFKNISDFSYTMEVYDAYYSANKDMIAIAYKNWKQIDLVSTSGELQQQIRFPDFDANLTKMSFNENLQIKPDAKLYFTFIYPAKDSFYALCWNSAKENIKQGDAKPDIYQFTWDGELKEIFHLDRPVSYFCIDDSGMLYAIAMSSEDYNLRIYTTNL